MAVVLDSSGGLHDRVKVRTPRLISPTEAKKRGTGPNDTRILIYDSMPESAQDFGNASIISAFSNAAGSNIVQPTICVNPAIEISEKLKESRADISYYVDDEDEALKRGHDILYLRGWARNKHNPLELEKQYQAFSKFYKKAGRHIPLIIAECAGAEGIGFDIFGIESELFAGGKKHGTYTYIKQDKKDIHTMGLSDRFQMQSSRYRDISFGLEEHKDIKVLFSNSEANVGLARSNDERYHFVLTHLENGNDSIAKEQRRDWLRYAQGEMDDEPTNAFGIIPEELDQEFSQFKRNCKLYRKGKIKALPTYNLERDDIQKNLNNTWKSDFTAYATSLMAIAQDMARDGRAQQFAPLYKPATESGVLAPA
jgi:hypothetical protein